MVLEREFVEVLASVYVSHLLHDLTPYLGLRIGAVLVPDHHYNPWITLEVLKRLGVHFGIDKEVLAIGANPDHMRL